jgi:hypothetical protein
MKTQKIILSLFVALCIATITSCKNGDDGPTPPAGETFTSYSEFIETNKVQPHVVALDPSVNNEFEGPRGTVIRIPGNALVDQSGNPVSGAVEVSIREFYDRKDIVLSGINTNAGSQMLVTAGAIELRASQDGQQLRLDPNASIAAAFPAINTANQNDGFEDQMMLFASEDDPQNTEEGFNWRMANDLPARLDSSSGSLNSFILTDLQLGWSNCDALYAIMASDRTQFEVEVGYPAGVDIDSEETQVFMLVKNLGTVINLYTRNGPAYTTYAGSVPVGLEATLVVISIVNDQLYFGSEKITVAGDDNFVVDIHPGSSDALEGLLEFPF